MLMYFLKLKNSNQIFVPTVTEWLIQPLEPTLLGPIWEFGCTNYGSLIATLWKPEKLRSDSLRHHITSGCSFLKKLYLMVLIASYAVIHHKFKKSRFFDLSIQYLSHLYPSSRTGPIFISIFINIHNTIDILLRTCWTAATPQIYA